MQRLSLLDYRRMLEGGIIPADANIELIDGRIYAMPPISSAHAAALTRLAQSFFAQAAVTKRAVVWHQNPIEILPDSAPQPDLALLQWRDDCYCDALPGSADILLVVEVADSTLARDLSKLLTYARAGIPEAWLIDVQGKTLSVARNRSPQGYCSVATDDGSVSPLHFPDLSVDLTALLRR